MENIKENKLYLKLVRNLSIFKLFNLYKMEENKWNGYEETYKNNLLTLNLFYIHFFFLCTFPLYFLSLKYFKKQKSRKERKEMLKKMVFSCLIPLWKIQKNIKYNWN